MRSFIQIVRATILFLAGYAAYLVRGQTPGIGYRAMRSLYCLTNGRFNAACGRVASVLHPKYRSAPLAGILGDFTASDAKSVVDTIKRDGFYVFEAPLSDKLVNDLRAFALATPSYPMSSQNPAGRPVVYGENESTYVKYDFDPADLMRNQAVQTVVSDPQLMAIAQEYLGARSVIDSVAMWWTTAAAAGASSEAAQLYHFDMDRLRFVKFFVYLTSVDTDTGPHCYVKGSHQRKHKTLRAIRRFQDDELEHFYPKDSFLELTGQRGQIIAVDTSGFHKGKHLTRDDRLIFEVEFAISLFGANYGKTKLPQEDLIPQMRNAVARFPFTYANLVE